MSPTHQNRNATRRPCDNPRPEEVRAARIAAGLTQAQAAGLVHSTTRAWQRWEATGAEEERRPMHPAIWELFRLKVAASDSG